MTYTKIKLVDFRAVSASQLWPALLLRRLLLYLRDSRHCLGNVSIVSAIRKSLGLLRANLTLRGHCRQIKSLSLNRKSMRLGQLLPEAAVQARRLVVRGSLRAGRWAGALQSGLPARRPRQRPLSKNWVWPGHGRKHPSPLKQGKPALKVFVLWPKKAASPAKQFGQRKKTLLAISRRAEGKSASNGHFQYTRD